MIVLLISKEILSSAVTGNLLMLVNVHTIVTVFLNILVLTRDAKTLVLLVTLVERQLNVQQFSTDLAVLVLKAGLETHKVTAINLNVE